MFLLGGLWQNFSKVWHKSYRYARRLELIVKTKENHNIEQEGNRDFRDGVTEMGCNVAELRED